MPSDYSQLPADLPVPVDDGAAAGLEGTPLERRGFRLVAEQGATVRYELASETRR